jgi:hypothetical protein
MLVLFLQNLKYTDPTYRQRKRLTSTNPYLPKKFTERRRKFGLGSQMGA